MVVEIKNVLVCDAVDESCTVLLEQNGINVIFDQFLINTQIYLKKKKKKMENADDWALIYIRGYFHE